MSKVILTSAALLAAFNPANAQTISDDDKAYMATLSKEEVAKLAAEYPNTAQNSNYLLLIDKRLPADKQVYQTSSWANLKYLWDLNQDHFAPFAFRTAENVTVPQPVATTTQNTSTSVTVDLSKAEAQNAEGLKRVAGTTELKEAPVVTLSEGLNAGLRDEKVADPSAIHGDIMAPKAPANVAGTTVLEEPAQISSVAPAAQVGQTANEAINGITLAQLESELEQLKADGAHHMTIKAKEKQIADLKAGGQ